MSSSRTITSLQDLQAASPPVLHLGLRPSREAPSRTAPATQGILQRIQQFLTAGEHLDLEQSADPAVTAANQKKVDAIFQGFKAQLDAQCDTVKAELATLTPQQQEDVLSFWSVATEWFSTVLSWMQKTFQQVLDKIRDGFKVVKEALKDFFQQAAEAFKAIFGN
ncbi:hypothetical protein BV898_14315 [Hypsibius exemplaris]|uniref:Uncharacterized protein n=1 Tax=Hypsibius exemplaris TaxID=2072580 RepID=A0A9X6NBW4_HYPEX|nr:hypothetical protein BV898_14315 [Hypsibius exemplaris]